ncbi:MAG: hypothetical protein OMM_15281, partial [Candidatus Magnetoglobus multicellularis str. Araruama]
SDNIVIGISSETPGMPFFQIYNADSPTTITGSEQIPLNQWVHMAVTSAGHVATLYMNGCAIGSSQSMNQASIVTRSNAYIAKSNWSGDAYADMIIDECRIWDIALTENEIRNAMCHKLNGNESGLFAYYRFDHNSDIELSDITSNQNHASLANMDDSDWIASKAPIGDISASDYSEYALSASLTVDR